MFRAIRAHFGTAWSRAREKRLFGLFAFEFVVVVLGVLTAQAVQSWALERDRNQLAEAERHRLEQGYLETMQGAKVWQAALPCLRERVGDVMRVASIGGNLSNVMAQRPKLPSFRYEGTNAETFARISKLAGRSQALTLKDVHDRSTIIDEASRELRSQWELFRLIGTDFGRPSSADHAAARVAGAKIFTELRNIEVALDMIELQRTVVRAKRVTPFDREFGILPVRSCAELWAKGTAYRDIEPGEASPY